MRAERGNLIRACLHGLVLALVVGLTGTACGTGPVSPSGTSTPRLPVGDTALPMRAPIWASGRTLHLGQRTVDVAHSIDALAATRGGIYFVSAGRLHLYDMHRTHTTSVRLGDQPERLQVSADGRYLSLLDTQHGPWDTGHQFHRPAVTVWDTETGRALVHSYAHMPSAKQDLSNFYEDAEPEILGFDRSHVYADVGSLTIYRYPLTGGAPTRYRPAEGPDQRVPPFVDPLGTLTYLRTRSGSAEMVSPTKVAVDTDLAEARVSPAGTLLITTTGGGGRFHAYDAATGAALPGRFPPTLDPAGWTGPESFYGVTTDPRTGDLTGLWSCDRGGCHLSVDRAGLGSSFDFVFPDGREKSL